MNDNRKRPIGGPAPALRAASRMRRAVYQLHLWTGLALGSYLAFGRFSAAVQIVCVSCLHRGFERPETDGRRQT